MVRRLNNNQNSRIRHRRGLVQKLWSTKGAVALALMAIVLPACDNNQTEEVTAQPGVTTPASPARTEPGVTTPAAPGNVTTEEVADKTAALIGKVVTIRSEPIKKVGANTFTVGDQEFFGTESILVVNASGKPFVLPTTDDPEVQVTGVVRRFVVADINRLYNLGLEPNLYAEYEGKPAIVAQSLAVATEAEEIAEEPREFYGRNLAVKGEVENIVAPNAFTLDDDELFGAGNLLVVNAAPRRDNVQEGQTVVVTGVLRPFVAAEIENEYDVDWDLEQERKLEVEYSRKPVLVIDAAYPSALPDAAK